MFVLHYEVIFKKISEKRAVIVPISWGDFNIFPSHRILNDDIIGEREFGISAGLLLLSECDELWYFGDRMTSGMTREICYAIEHGILVKYIPQSDYEEYLEERSGDYEMQ